jgi:peptidoglycan-associated lipoprotein
MNYPMTNKSLAALVLLVMIAPLLLLSACGKKRPPVVTTKPTTRATPTPPPEVTETGPDVRPVDESQAAGEDFSVSDPSGEGGPLADIHFDYDQSALTDEARAILEKHALWLQNHREAKVMVEGHCDERGTVEYNLALGNQRAQVTRDYLASLGVAADRLRTTSYGKERPLDPGHDEAAWARNRRAHFAVSR